MTIARLLPIGLMLSLASFVAGQNDQSNGEAKETPRPPHDRVSCPFCQKPWAQWPSMTGDWDGVRTDLADKGVTFKLDLTQVMQGNAYGGASTKNGLRYSGSADLTVMFDTGKLGLWPGGMVVVNAEPK